MNTPVYNKVGNGYNATRKADPYITGRLYALLEPVPGGLYLDVGCGTGNYLYALSDKGLQLYGADPSEVMLSVAKKKNPDAILLQAKAEHLPLAEGMFNGVIAVFTLHHWDDIGRGLAEVRRVMKPGARLVCLSFTPEQVRSYWLCHYFPRMMDRSADAIPGMEDMESLVNKAGLLLKKTEKYFVQEQLQDHFLYSNKYRPERYLLPEVRNGASSFTVFADPDEVASGLKLLEADIASGKIAGVMKAYEQHAGDYLFWVAEKPY